MERTPSPIPGKVNEVSKHVVDSAFVIYKALGPGLLESAYESCLVHELTKKGLKVVRQLTVPIIYDGIKIDAGYRINLLVDECLIVELKSVESILPIHEAQTLTYLKLMGLRLGLLINFNVEQLKKGIKRIVL
jgi:GxxExxY protein